MDSPEILLMVECSWKKSSLKYKVTKRLLVYVKYYIMVHDLSQNHQQGYNCQNRVSLNDYTKPLHKIKRN